MKHAFSLVELSIVLVILGLLTGGILAGQSLIRASELRSVNTTMQNYTTAIYTFRDKYFGLPGDFNNAKAFWPTCTDHTNNNCNGDGDGKWMNNGCTSVQSAENNRTWQHLSLAGLIEGTYTVLNANCAYSIYAGIPGSTVPRLRLPNGGVMLYDMPGQGGLPSSTGNANVMQFGALGGNALEASLLRPEETWNIDTKVDDGLPLQGSIRAIAGSSSTCVTSAAYALDNAALGCRMLKRMDR